MYCRTDIKTGGMTKAPVLVSIEHTGSYVRCQEDAGTCHMVPASSNTRSLSDLQAAINDTRLLDSLPSEALPFVPKRL